MRNEWMCLSACVTGFRLQVHQDGKSKLWSVLLPLGWIWLKYKVQSVKQYIPLDVRVNSLQPFVVVFPFFKKGFNVDICDKWDKILVSSPQARLSRIQQILYYMQTYEYFTIRSRGKLIEIKLQIVHFVLWALLVCKILSKQNKGDFNIFQLWARFFLFFCLRDELRCNLRGILSCSFACPLLLSCFWACGATANIKHT